MTFNHINLHLVVPALFFLGIWLVFVSLTSILTSLAADPSFVVVGWIAFLLGYNSIYFGLKIKRDSAV